MKILLRIVNATGVALLGLFILYTITNTTGQTAFNPYWGLLFFIPQALLGIWIIFFSADKHHTYRYSAIALLVGLAGIALLVYLDTSNTLVEYNTWLQRHMN